jgi:hypothetical protein
MNEAFAATTLGFANSRKATPVCVISGPDRISPPNAGSTMLSVSFV